ncbi:MAG: hypothetical protein IIA61_00205 [Candidatus Marinimicrobia bacterium]|nr:hypothetical protein [Candidatus Neomarinimicrobiota bacterium]
MFENYVEEQKELLPFVKKQYNMFPKLQLPSFYESGNNFIESRIRNNTTKWWREIENCVEEICYAYCFFKEYICLKDTYHEDVESDSFNRAYEILLFEIPFWTNNLLSRLYSFREKIAHLIFFLNDGVLRIGRKNKKYRMRDISFSNIHQSIRDFSQKDKLPVWLSYNDKEVMLKALKEFGSEEVKNLLDIRHAFIHNSSPAIDTTGTGLLLFGGEMNGDGNFSVEIERPPNYDYQTIESEFLKIWEIFKENTIKISRLEFFQ